MGFNYTTKVKIDLKGLREEVKELKSFYDQIGNRDSHEGRSRFSAYNNIKHFLDRYDNNQDFVVLELTGAAKGTSARVYYTPSITSLAKPIRKYIVPLKEGNKFMYFDLKAAEFFMNCVFCGEDEAIRAYNDGKDIYMTFSNLFPEGTPRKVIKECLIANMYGVTSYTISKRCGITEAQADRLLQTVQRSLIKMEMQKVSRFSRARSKNAYFAPHGFDQTRIEKVADIDPAKGYQPNLALSAYVQSALGFWMQDFINNILPKTQGTLLTVFDSTLIEFDPINEQRLIKWLSEHIKPFRTDEYKIGSTFYQAQES